MHPTTSYRKGIPMNVDTRRENYTKQSITPCIPHLVSHGPRFLTIIFSVMKVAKCGYLLEAGTCASEGSTYQGKHTTPSCHNGLDDVAGRCIELYI